MENINEVLNKLSKSKFRSSFKLKQIKVIMTWIGDRYNDFKR